MDRARLLNAYVRRLEWEHRMLAVQIVSVLGEALGGGKSGKAAGGQQPRRVQADELLGKLGVVPRPSSREAGLSDSSNE